MLKVDTAMSSEDTMTVHDSHRTRDGMAHRVIPLDLVRLPPLGNLDRGCERP